jgi:hypothetical protein
MVTPVETENCEFLSKRGKHLSISFPTSLINFPRYYAKTSGIVWPPEIRDYNTRFTQVLDNIKKRHDPTVTTVAQGVLEWKRSQKAKDIAIEIQAWLDRFYLSRIGIRFLIGQRKLHPQSLIFHYQFIVFQTSL